MTRYLVSRLVRMVLAVLSVTTVVFVLMRLSGDPAALILGPNVTAEGIAEVRRELGLDQPMYVQYVRFMARAAHGDFGKSLVYGTSAMPIVRGRLAATVQLAIFGMGLTVGVSIPLGVMSAINKGTIFDTSVLGICLLAQSMPSFWLGIMLIMFFAVNLHLLPTSGREELASLVLPAMSVAANFIARITLLVRSQMIEALMGDYIRTARSKGLTEHQVTYRHALRNAAIPAITMIGMSLGPLLGGAVITETVFAWPGMGYLAVRSAAERDFPVAQACVFVMAICVVVVNLLTDLLCPFIDPRIGRTQ